MGCGTSRNQVVAENMTATPTAQEKSTAPTVPTAATAPTAQEAEEVTAPSAQSSPTPATTSRTTATTPTVPTTAWAAATTAQKEMNAPAAEKMAPGTSLMEYVKKGVPVLAKAVEALAPMLPFPGGEAAALVSAVLGMTERAIANHDNLRELRERAVAYLDLLGSYHPVLVQVAQYHTVVGEYKEHLQGIVVYSETYCSRNCLLKLLTGVIDEAHFQELVEGMRDLTERTMLLLQTDTMGRVQNVEGMVGEALGYLKASAKYQDNSADIQRLVDEAGGSVKDLVASPWLLDEALGRLDIRDRLSIQMVTSVLTAQTEDGPHRHIRQPELQVMWKNSFRGEPEVPWYTFWDVFPKGLLPEEGGNITDEEEEEEVEEGKQSDDGGSVRSKASGGSAASAGNAVQELAATKGSGIGGVGGSKQLVKQLEKMLRSDAAQRAFTRAVDRDNNDRVSVYELRLAFSGEESLLEQVKKVLAAAIGGAAAVKGRRQGRRKRGRRRRQRRDSRSEDSDDDGVVVRSRSEDADDSDSDDLLPVLCGRCMLPPLDPSHVGREEEEAELAEQLKRAGSLVLLARGGMGKSSLAAAVGWILYGVAGGGGGGGGGLKGGVFWVDLREAHRGVEVEARFCAALGMQREEKENVRRIATALRKTAESADDYGRGAGGGRVQVLVVVDNAEDAVGSEEAAEVLRSLLKELVGRGMEGVRVLVTTRAPLGLPGRLPYKEHRVGPIRFTAAVQVVRAAAQDLTEEEAGRVAAACRCVPLYLRLVSEAVVAGRLRVEDIALLEPVPPQERAALQPQSSSGVSVGSDDDNDGSCKRSSGSGSSSGGADPLLLVLKSLKPAHQAAMQQLAVFPSGFDAEAAAAVLQTSHEQAHALLTVLYGNSLLLRGGRGGDNYIVHKAVRQAVLATATAGGDTAARAAAEARHGLHVLRLLGQWAKMYGSNEFGLALAMARDCQPDIGRLAELMAAPPAAGGGGAALRVAIKANLAADADLAVALSYKVCSLLEALGALSSFEAGWRVLLDAAKAAGDEAQQGALLALLARVSFQRGHYQEGRQRAQAAVNLLRADGAKEEPPHPDAAAAALNNLALCLKAEGSTEAAERLLRRALSIRQRVFGDQHPDSVGVMLNLASCLKARGRLQEALPLYRQVLDLRQDILSDRHPDTGAAYNSMANCLEAMGNGGREAEDLYRSALSALEAALGDEHPYALAASSNLARCLKGMGDVEEAEGRASWTLEAQERVLGPEHPETVATMHTLAACLQAQHRHDEAEKMFRRVLDVWRSGADGGAEGGGSDDGQGGEGSGGLRPEALASMLEVARCISEGNRDKEAEPLYREVLEARQQLLGREHSDTLAAKVALADCLRRQGQLKEAQGMLTEVVELQRRTLGLADPVTLVTEHALATCALELGDGAAEAEKMLRSVLQSRMRVLGMKHADTLATMEALANSLMMQERFAEAQPIFELARGMGGMGGKAGKGGGRRGDDDDDDDRDRRNPRPGGPKGKFISVQAN